MENMTDHVLSYMTFFPMAGMIVVLLLPSDRANLIRWTSALFTLPPLLLAGWLYGRYPRPDGSIVPFAWGGALVALGWFLGLPALRLGEGRGGSAPE